ncbi:2-keto-4-pentenoate hydratase [Shinella sp.]|uniref:2-keto-4-pentenoate hydratase n=1 Tax=Shinella sp. TaxID=1870904 RepID=UPI003F7105C2
MSATIDLARIAETLDAAAIAVQPIAQTRETLDVGQAYEAQRLGIVRREARGERRIGIKMGLTSRAKMAQVGIDEVIWGRLTDGMIVEEGGSLQRARFIHPRAEPEIAFRLRAPLEGVVTEMEAWDAVECIAPAIEILDSRYRDFKFNLGDAIADNCSSAGLVVGPWQSREIDISNLGMAMDIDGRAVALGSSAAILGHPIRTLTAAARLMARNGDRLQPGDIFLSGAPTAAIPLSAGMRVRLRVEKLGTCAFSFA